MATAQIVPARTETQIRVVEPEYVNLKLTPGEASALKTLAMKAVAWKASGEFGARMESVWRALQHAGVAAELGLRCEPDENVGGDGYCPRDRVWVTRF